jgi:acyl-CoA reductase-like NAD-dependent aldehyde dehydrogenase
MGSIVSNKPISFKTFHNVIDGQLKDAQTSYTGYNPITEDRLWETPIATKQDLDDSVVAANRAFSSWKRTTWAERSHLLTDYAEKIAYYAAEIVDLLFLETGKPVRYFIHLPAYPILMCVTP